MSQSTGDAAANGHQRGDNRQRLLQIMEVVRRHDIVKGMTPDKLCAIIEDLGPTFIKLGQILSMRSDILPKSYCEGLKKLRGDVTPMPYSQVLSIVERSYGRPIDEVFSKFDQQALGSASIAQVHAATLKTGEEVVVKVQREGIHEVMSRDIMLLKQACKLLKYTPVGDLVDFNQVLDEMWVVAQEEMNFQTEAGNLEKFHKLNENFEGVTSPALYRDYTTTILLVMERVDGVKIDDLEGLKKAGGDPGKIGQRLAENYVKQIVDDGFFHADPHPGNLRYRDGKIVWLDMGMMGSLTDGQKKLIGKAVTGVARGDINTCREAVMGLGEFHGEVDKRRLYKDIEAMLDKYGTADVGSIDIAKVFEDMTQVMKANNIAMPAGLTMLARGLATIEGVLADLSPEVNVMGVVTSRVGKSILGDIDWNSEIKQDIVAVYQSLHKSLEIPALMADIIRTGLKGEAIMGVEHHVGNGAAALLRELTLKLCVFIVSAALFIAAGCLWQAEPRLGGISWYSVACFVAGLAALGWVLFKKDWRNTR